MIRTLPGKLRHPFWSGKANRFNEMSGSALFRVTDRNRNSLATGQSAGYSEAWGRVARSGGGACAMKRILVLLALTVAAPAFGQDLEDFRQREAVIAQKWTREVATAIDASRRLERADPAAARQTLDAALGQIKSAPGLTDAMRSDFARQLNNRMAALPASAPAPTTVTPPRPTGFAEYKAGTPIPSTFAPTSPPPGGVADTARNLFQKQGGSVADTSKASDTAGNAYNKALQGIGSGVVPDERGVNFSPEHKALADRRAPQLNPKEEAVMAGLGKQIDADFTGMNFRQALDSIMQKSGLIIIPDAVSMKDANVEYEDPVNFRLPAKISTRAALRKILGDRGLSYVVTDGGISVVTVQKARESTVARVYNIRDLVQPLRPQPQYVVGPYGGLTPVAPNTFPPGTPGVTPSFSQQMGQTVAEMVRTSVDPTYWAPTGPGMIVYNDATGSLIVRASAEIHFMVNSALNRR
jgi:hypothetical protein